MQYSNGTVWFNQPVYQQPVTYFNEPEYIPSYPQQPARAFHNSAPMNEVSDQGFYYVQTSQHMMETDMYNQAAAYPETVSSYEEGFHSQNTTYPVQFQQYQVMPYEAMNNAPHDPPSPPYPPYPLYPSYPPYYQNSQFNYSDGQAQRFYVHTNVNHYQQQTPMNAVSTVTFQPTMNYSTAPCHQSYEVQQQYGQYTNPHPTDQNAQTRSFPNYQRQAGWNTENMRYQDNNVFQATNVSNGSNHWKQNLSRHHQKETNQVLTNQVAPKNNLTSSQPNQLSVSMSSTNDGTQKDMIGIVKKKNVLADCSLSGCSSLSYVAPSFHNSKKDFNSPEEKKKNAMSVLSLTEVASVSFESIQKEEELPKTFSSVAINTPNRKLTLTKVLTCAVKPKTLCHVETQTSKLDNEMSTQTDKTFEEPMNKENPTRTNGKIPEISSHDAIDIKLSFPDSALNCNSNPKQKTDSMETSNVSPTSSETQQQMKPIKKRQRKNKKVKQISASVADDLKSLSNMTLKGSSTTPMNSEQSDLTETTTLKQQGISEKTIKQSSTPLIEKTQTHSSKKLPQHSTEDLNQTNRTVETPAGDFKKPNANKKSITDAKTAENKQSYSLKILGNFTIDQVKKFVAFDVQLTNILKVYINNIAKKRYAFLGCQKSENRITFSGMEKEIVTYLKNQCVISVNRMRQDPQFRIDEFLDKLPTLGEKSYTTTRVINMCAFCLQLGKTTETVLIHDLVYLFARGLNVIELKSQIEQYFEHVMHVAESETADNVTSFLLEDISEKDVKIDEKYLIHFQNYINEKDDNQNRSSPAFAKFEQSLRNGEVEKFGIYLPRARVWSSAITRRTIQKMRDFLCQPEYTKHPTLLYNCLTFMMDFKSYILDNDFYYLDVAAKNENVKVEKYWDPDHMLEYYFGVGKHDS